MTGPRGWTDLPVVQHALLDARDHPPPTVLPDTMLVVSGGCPTGLDRMAENVARQWRWPVEVHPADWGQGKAAGFRRNAMMVSLGADLCLAFAMPCTVTSCRKPGQHGTHGTRDCADRAKAAGIPVRWYAPRDQVP